MPESSSSASAPSSDADSAAAQQDPLAERVTGLIEAGLVVGASVARGLARATGGPAIQPSGAPLDDLVASSTQIAVNLARFATDAGRSAAGAGRTVADTATRAARRSAQAASDALPDVASSGGRPTVDAGSTLRVPLLVENTSNGPTGEIGFAATVEREGCPDHVDGAPCTCLPAGAVTFTPPTLVIAPKDFEKLTVRVATTPETPAGDYTVRISGGDGWFASGLSFTVRTAGG